MSRSKIISESPAIAVALTAIAIQIFMVSVASASTPGWVIGEERLLGTAALATTASVDERFRLKAAGVTVECTGSTLNVIGSEIKAPNTMAATSITFNGCSAGAPCSLATSSFGTVPLSAELTELLAPEDKVVFTPKTKMTFATLKFEGATCLLEGVQPVT